MFNVDMSSLRAPWENGPYKNNTQNDTKTRTTSWRNIHLEKLYFVFFNSKIFYFIVEKKQYAVILCWEIDTTYK